MIEKVANRAYENVVRHMLWKVGVYRMKLGKTNRDQTALSEVSTLGQHISHNVISHLQNCLTYMHDLFAKRFFFKICEVCALCIANYHGDLN